MWANTFKAFSLVTRASVLNQPPLELNPYVYTTNNSLRWIDPDGQNTIAIGGGIGAAIGGPPGAVIGAGIGAVIGVGGYLIYQHCKVDEKECERRYEQDMEMCDAIGRAENSANDQRVRTRDARVPLWNDLEIA